MKCKDFHLERPLKIQGTSIENRGGYQLKIQRTSIENPIQCTSIRIQLISIWWRSGRDLDQISRVGGSRFGRDLDQISTPDPRDLVEISTRSRLPLEICRLASSYHCSGSTPLTVLEPLRVVSSSPVPFAAPLRTPDPLSKGAPHPRTQRSICRGLWPLGV